MENQNETRPIPGEPMYFASTDGRIYSERKGRRRELSQSIRNGYPTVSLRRGGVGVREYVHTLVCKTFLGPRPSASHQVRHLDDVKTNGRLSNLAWGTVRDQMEDRRRNGSPCLRGRLRGLTRVQRLPGPVPEELRPIPGWGGYLASACGRIFTQKRRPGRAPAEMALQSFGDYPKVTLSRNGKPHRLAVHVLICTTFHGPKPGPGYQVLHGDHNPSNAAAQNLRWGTREENMADRVAAGTLAGMKSGRVVLSDQQALEVKSLLAAGSCRADVARHFGVHINTVRSIQNGRIRAYLPNPVDPSVALPRRERQLARGSSHGNAKITEAQAAEILATPREESSSVVALRYGISKTAVQRIRSGKQWAHVGSTAPVSLV